MNEITQIHLGRTAFTIAVDAQKLLRDYPAAVIKHMGGNEDAANEVEMRMAELLIERGIASDKVVLASDVEYLKSQLGEPGDFDDQDADGAKETKTAGDEAAQRRLFRDTEHGMIAGVAAGLANYFQIDAVIVRILFVVATLTGGWGIPIYIILWLIVPEAKTSSDTLRMRGKAVNVDTLKNLVEQADVPGATRRARNVVGRVLEGVFKVFLGIVGVSVILAAAALLFGVVTGGIYMFRHGGTIFQEHFFPQGTNELLLTVCGLITVAVIAVLLLLTGVAMIKRRWQLPGWGVAALFGLLILGLGSTAALGADVAPEVAKRYEAAHHTSIRSVQPFTRLDVESTDATIEYRYSKNHSVELHYLGNPNLKPIKTQVKDDVLVIDTEDFALADECHGFCIWADDYDLKITVRSPEQPDVTRTENIRDLLKQPEPIAPAEPASVPQKTIGN